MKRRRTKAFAVAGLAAVLVACASRPGQDYFDRVIEDARIYTVDTGQPWASAMAIRDGRIVYVGDAVPAHRVGPGTVRMLLDGKLVLPGFIDTHIHPISGGAYARALSLDTYGRVDEWIAEIDRYARDNPDLPVLFGYGFLATTFGPGGPDRQQLDAVVPDRPVLIMDEGFHADWANSAALRRLGIDRHTPDPAPGYSYYKRDAAGEPTGYLLEATAEAAMDRLEVVNQQRIIEGTALVVDWMNGYGVTAAFDAGALGPADQVSAVLQALQSRGALTLRLVGSYRPEPGVSPQAAVQTAALWRDTVSGERYRYDTLKIPYDGTVESRTAAMFEDYQGEPGNRGQTALTPQALGAMVTDAADRNLDVHVHALGERAVRDALDAVAAARIAHPDTDSRFTLCHLQVIADDDIERFGRLGVIAQSTPLWASYDTWGEPFVSADQFRRFWRFAELAEAGARLTFGSDFPATGAGRHGLSPLLQIEIGHTRQLAGQPDAPIQPRVSNRLALERLVRGFTLDAAWQLRLEKEVGSIEVGKRADLVVLGDNLFEVDPYAIHRIPVVMTLLDGEVIYDLADLGDASSP